MPTGASRPTGWLSYDEVAETYQRIAVPWFTPLARDLVVAARISRGARVLDLGAGTGLTASLVKSVVGPAGFVVAADPSTGMLSLARARGGIFTVLAVAPGLPFSSSSFDAVVANLVISHLPDLDRGLADAVRMLRPGGRFGVTAWAPDSTDPEDQGAEADGIVAAARQACGLPSELPVPGVPWEEHLRIGTNLSDALTRAGLDRVEIELHTYRHIFTIDDYAAGWGSLGRYLRWTAGERRWRDFAELASRRLRDRLGPTITSIKRAWVATATAREP